LVGSNQRNYFENANACSKRMLKTTVATQLKGVILGEGGGTMRDIFIIVINFTNMS